MKALELKKEGSVYVLTMINGKEQNCHTLDVFYEYLAVFDEVEASSEPAALVWTSSDPKFWCTGANLNWAIKNLDKAEKSRKISSVVFARAALLNLPTIACITGHCYAGGALFAAACDFRFMRKDRGRICTPEVDVKVPFSGSMQEVFDLYPNAQARKEMLLTGRAYGGEEAEKLGIVDYACDEADLFPDAMKMAEKLSLKGRDIYTSLKHSMRGNLMKYIKMD
jgi:enoyl-CoA hydratase/carnithine racemase